jgi:hypothetical protein
MTRTMRLLASVSVLAATAFAASPAFAAGTTAGTTVTNSVTLDYKVGGIDQTQLTTSTDFIVDRKVNLTVTETGNLPTTVSPGQTGAVTLFSVTNSSNAPLDFALAVTQPGGTAPHGGTDNFDVTNAKIYADTNGNGSYDPGTDQETTYLDQVAADTSRTVFIVADVPVGRATNDIAIVRLSATAAEATASGSLGGIVAQSTGANNTMAMETVFADTDSGGNVARNGIHFADDDYKILAATLTATKTSRVISDPFNGTTDAKMIPGAVVEYCITVANAAGSAAATSVSITDDVPDETTYDPAFGIKLNGTVTGSSCNADGTSGGSYTDGIVSGTISSIAAGTARTLVFRVSVN